MNTRINHLFPTLGGGSRLRLVLNTRLQLLYCMLVLRVVQVCRMLLLLMLLLLLLLPGVRLVAQVLVVILGRGVIVLVKRFLVDGRFPVDRQLGHYEVISGPFCVVAHVVIRHHMLRLGVLLAGLVPRKQRVHNRRRDEEEGQI